MSYLIGDGSLINMWTDNWIPDHPPRPLRAGCEVVAGEKVRDHFLDNRAVWDEPKLREVIIAEDVERILSIRLSPMAQNDLMGWYYNEDGLYTVKSGYWLGTHLPNGTLPSPTYGSTEIKRKIWKTKAPAKVKHLLWKLLSRSLATGN